MRGATVVAFCALGALACERTHAAEPEPAAASAPATAREAPRATDSVASREGRPPTPRGPTSARVATPPASAPDSAHYGWLANPDAAMPPPVDSLAERFAPPDGAEREPVAAGSFAAWLRGLPLAKAGTPVRSFRGTPLYEPDDPRIAAVVAIDVGNADLQQCADAVIRLHAEWSWSRGRRDMSYRAAAGVELPLARYARGERIAARGSSIAWQPGGKAGSDHATFRGYLNTVFAWANTVSLEKQAKAVEPDQLAAGDFFVLPGNPGHTVLVLDVARQGERRFALLGQSFMPAQSFQVLRPSARSAWFELSPDRDVVTPFWRPFPWSSLRRL